MNGSIKEKKSRIKNRMIGKQKVDCYRLNVVFISGDVFSGMTI